MLGRLPRLLSPSLVASSGNHWLLPHNAALSYAGDCGHAEVVAELLHAGVIDG